MIIETFNGTRRATGMFQSCVVDAYGLRQCAHAVESVIDIGANVGFFSVAARVLCPKAQIVSIEPDKATFSQLLKNVDHLRIQPINAALGTGEPVKIYLKPPEDRGCYGTRYDSGGNGKELIRSHRFERFVDVFEMKNLFIKIDCEGSEHLLVGDLVAGDIIKKSIGFCGEVHPTFEGAYERFYEWIHKLLSETHEIKFFRQYRKGIAEFTAIRKETMNADCPDYTNQTREMKMLQDAVMFRGERKWYEGQVASIEYELASHMVSCGYCQYFVDEEYESETSVETHDETTNNSSDTLS